jgi:hypothetical protein
MVLPSMRAVAWTVNVTFVFKATDGVIADFALIRLPEGPRLHRPAANPGLVGDPGSRRAGTVPVTLS